MTQTPLSTGSPVRVILVPYPVSLLSSFAYYVFTQTGFSSPYVFYRWRSFDENQDSAVRKCLFGPTLFVKVLVHLETLPQRINKYLLRRILTFCQSPNPEHKLVHSELQRNIARISGSPREILETCAMYWAEVVSGGLDPFKNSLPSFPVQPEGQTDEPLLVEPVKRETIYLSRPKYDGQLDERGRAVVVGSTEFALEETRARLLSGRHLTVGVFGPPRVGKSTTVASLVDEVLKLVKSLSTRLGWESFNLKVDSLNLDLGTPTLDEIKRGKGQNREALQKHVWTMDMAVEGFARLENARKETNLLFVDLPGQIDEITELLGGSLDGGILIIPSGESGYRDTWGKFLDEVLAIERLALIFSTSVQEGEESMVRAHTHHRTARGQIVRFNRLVRSYDPFIVYLAKVLLYDLLPDIVEKRHNARAKLLR